MEYEGIVYRPPSEAYSLIVQVTIGCSHNGCTFCGMYKDKKFRVRELKDIISDLEQAKLDYGVVKRIFLADGDALVLKTSELKIILLKIKELFPGCERVGVYTTPKDILAKSVEDLSLLKALGIGILYLGVESGSNEILKSINKGVTAQNLIMAGRKVKESGIKLSTTLISGIGGREKISENAIESAKLISAINPDYVGFLTLMLESGTPIYKDIQNGIFHVLTPEEVVQELREFLENVEVTNCIFRSNHASNYVSLSGTLPVDKDKLLSDIDITLKGKHGYKQEEYRRL
ncbi:radical SAM protein [Clostridium estertheticum]|uniref:Radical SAM protein n=1 Tax=Clostridium estertheticum subsp. estertheticum TaxID=1552 RepID=A0A1J0GPC3_9CLOT|nr:radical SAM protein [Clostridium estertheticum]APC42758.1 radical SAM protein [Clostridium estertheticum subsp. estertheticum]MBU3073385.1 radical SAM protein [Clostridium estertheticum]MBU3163374.1 radical SAM protein [Clostridium estertheticum]MBU3171539.1 radical SAM protein [Clostridium estertheticum]MBZ9616336.1 radical SAM protein [Clostridium estertheticum subsp. laramiense]